MSNYRVTLKPRFSDYKRILFWRLMLRYLTERGYDGVYYESKENEQNVSIARTYYKILIDINSDDNEDKWQINIYCRDWMNYGKRPGDEQIVVLIKDFLISNYISWYYIETLTPNEVDLVDTLPRSITPLKIINFIDANNPDYSNRQPNLFKINHGSDETIIMWANKENFKDIVDFWVACLSWDFQETPHELITRWTQKTRNNQRSYNDFYPNIGRCIPLNIKAEKIVAGGGWNIRPGIKQMHELIPGLGKLMECYDMGLKPLDKYFLFQFENNFVVRNWWSGN